MLSRFDQTFTIKQFGVEGKFGGQRASMNILLTGGTGYIGSHTAVVLAKAGHEVVLLDNLFNSRESVVDRLNSIIGRDLPFVKADVRNRGLLTQTLRTYEIDAVIHFAGLKAVGESFKSPVDYYASNVQGTIVLLQAMQASNIKTFVFSSSATVYGDPHYLPIDEGHPTSATNPYGRTKLHVEEILADVARSDGEWRVASLRYFNPVGAHNSGLIGEDPTGIPNNLMAYIARVAAGKLPHLNVFGNDFDTADGTGIRDYIHVMDVAEGHLAVLRYLVDEKYGKVLPSKPGDRWPLMAVNLGTGNGKSVLDMVRAFEAASGRPVPYRIVARRPGDVAACYATADKAAVELGWKASRTLHDMCASAWQFQLGQCGNTSSSLRHATYPPL